MRCSGKVLATICFGAATILAMVGCNASSNDLAKIAACSGDYSGPFTGDIVGTATATVSSDGTVHFEFSPIDPSQIADVSKFSYQVEGVTKSNFSVSGDNDTSEFSINGTFNFDDCSLSGDWSLKDKGGAYDVSGSYVISKQASTSGE